LSTAHLVCIVVIKSGLGNWTFRYVASSPLGRFATGTLHYLDVLPPGCFAPLDVSIPERFTSSVGVSPPDDKEVLTVLQITDFETGGETSREIAKRPGIETSKGAKRPGGKLSRW